MKKTAYLHINEYGDVVSTPGTWVNKGTMGYLVDVCTDTHETEHMLYHFEPAIRNQAIKWINARPVIDTSKARTLDEYMNEHPDHLSSLSKTRLKPAQ